MDQLGMHSSHLDGPYRLGGGPSLKRTTAADLEVLGTDLLLSAGGAGPLTHLGITPHGARVVIALMAKEDYPGLVRDNTSALVAHKAGWLSTVQDDVALVFGLPGGPCVEAITTEGLSFASADALASQFAERVLPFLK